MDNKVEIFTHVINFKGRHTKSPLFYFNINKVSIEDAMEHVKTGHWPERVLDLEELPRPVYFPKFAIGDIVSRRVSDDVVYVQNKVIKITWTGEWAYTLEKNGHIYSPIPENKIFTDEERPDNENAYVF